MDGIDLLPWRWVSLYETARAIRRGGMPRPRMAIVYPVYGCNQNCRGCDYAELNRDARTMFTPAQFADVVDQVAALGARSAEFCGGGEPMLHPWLLEAVRRLRDREISVGVLTNGTRIDADAASVLVRNCAYVRVSVEAGTRETFNRVKRPTSDAAGWDRVIDGIRYLVAARRATSGGGDRRCLISYKMAVSTVNAGDLGAAVDLAARLGVDSIQYKAIRNVPEELPESSTRRLDTILDGLRARNLPLRIVGRLSPSPAAGRCWISPVQTTIDPRGDVYLCCYYRHRAASHRIGNLFATRLAAIWGSVRHRQAIAAIDPRDCARYDCRFRRYNALLDEALAAGQLEFV